MQFVSVAVAGQLIVAAAAPDTFDTFQRIAGGLTTISHTTGQIDRYAAAVIDIAGDIKARTTQQFVGPTAAGQGVVTTATVQGVAYRITAQRIAVTAADEVFDVRVAVTIGIAACATDIQTGGDTRGCLAIADRIDTVATIHRVRTYATYQGVVTAATDQGVVAGIADEQVGIGITDQAIRKLRTFEVLNAVKGIA